MELINSIKLIIMYMNISTIHIEKLFILTLLHGCSEIWSTFNKSVYLFINQETSSKFR
jgi:hypothetical protein